MSSSHQHQRQDDFVKGDDLAESIEDQADFDESMADIEHITRQMQCSDFVPPMPSNHERHVIEKHGVEIADESISQIKDK